MTFRAPRENRGRVPSSSAKKLRHPAGSRPKGRGWGRRRPEGEFFPVLSSLEYREFSPTQNRRRSDTQTPAGKPGGRQWEARGGKGSCQTAGGGGRTSLSYPASHQNEVQKRGRKSLPTTLTAYSFSWPLFHLAHLPFSSFVGKLCV